MLWFSIGYQETEMNETGSNYRFCDKESESIPLNMRDAFKLNYFSKRFSWRGHQICKTINELNKSANISSMYCRWGVSIGGSTLGQLWTDGEFRAVCPNDCPVGLQDIQPEPDNVH